MTSKGPDDPNKTTRIGDSDLQDVIAKALLALESEGAAGVERIMSEHPHYKEQIRRRLSEASKEDAARTQENQDWHEPEWIGEFKILEIIGSGGMGIVYKARHERLDRVVALKIMRGHATSTQKARQRFLREARVASRLSHPGLCTVYEMGEEADVPFIAMEFIDGEPLDKRIQRVTSDHQLQTESFEDFESFEDATPSSLATDGVKPESRSEDFTQVESIDELLKIFSASLRALHAGHESGMVHRDLKPSNIIIRRNGDPVILDFGLAVAPETEDLALTQPGEVLGTPAYMSPEQVVPTGFPIDRRTDIYSMGVSLYHCVTGRRPFAAPTRQQLFREILQGITVKPRRHNPRISRDLEIVLSTAMDPNRERRYQTAAGFADDLDRILNRRPIHAKRTSVLLRSWRWAQRNPVTATLSLALLLFLAVFSVTLSITNVRLDNQRSELADTLDRLTRLSDRRKLDDLITAAEELWPARPETIERMHAWLFDVDALLADADQHLKDFARLQGDSLPYSLADQARDHPTEAIRQAELKRTQQDLTILANSATTEKTADQVDSWLDDIDVESGSLQETLRTRKTWRFAEGEQMEWRFGLLAEIVQRIDLLRNRRKSVDDRRLFAESIRERTVASALTDWAGAASRVSADSRFAGFDLEPITGLLPLGPGPESQLEEFLHLDTHVGEIPERSPDNGALPFEGRTGIILVLVPGGRFSMGAARSGINNVDKNAIEVRESPVNTVTLSPFLIARHELTQGQWRRFHLGRKAENRETDVLPIGNVRWLDCRSVLRHMDLSLPTEAQWEYAARGETNTVWWTGDDLESLHNAANLADLSAASAGRTWPSISEWPATRDGFELTAPVHMLRPNAFGLHHVIGNVAEWCQDAFQGYQAPPLQGDGLRTLIPASTRVIRGGSYYSSPYTARSAVRSHDRPDARSEVIGVRAARSAKP